MLRKVVQLWRYPLGLQPLKTLRALHLPPGATVSVWQSDALIASRCTEISYPALQTSIRFFSPSRDTWQQDGNGPKPASPQAGADATATATAAADAESQDDSQQQSEQDTIIAQQKEEIESLKERVKSLLADMENLRQRTSRQAENAQKFAIQAFVKDILDVPDNLERATELVKKNVFDGGDIKLDVDKDKAVATLKSLLEGVELTDKVLMQILARNGVERLNPLDQPFDPNMHQALFEVPDPNRENGIIAHVVKVGYLLHGRVVRPAHVGVVKSF